MAEYEYHPDFCSACLKDIDPDGPVVIIDDCVEKPRYYHEKCLFDFSDLIARLHNYPEKWNGANDDRF